MKRHIIRKKHPPLTKKQLMKTAKACQYYKYCDTGDVLSPRRPYDVLGSCDDYSKKCCGGKLTKNTHKS